MPLTVVINHVLMSECFTVEMLFLRISDTCMYLTVKYIMLLNAEQVDVPADWYGTSCE